MAAATAVALRRAAVPTASASTAATASSAPVPTSIRARLSAGTGQSGTPVPARMRAPTATARAAANSPVTKLTAPITTALAASSRPRRGEALSEARISPRRYSAVMNIAPTTINGISPMGVPASALWRERTLPSPARGVMSPEPVTVIAPAPWRSVPGCGTPFGPEPPTLVPVHLAAVQESPMWRKMPVAVAVLPLLGAAANSPACTVEVSPGRAAVPASVQCVPSAESYPVIVAPSRTSRSQRGEAADTLPVRPGVSLT